MSRDRDVFGISSRENWLALRRRDVTASVCAALLALHERVTPLQLYLHHTGVVSLEAGADTPPMRRGRLMQPVAVEVIRELHPDWEVEEAREYIRDPDTRLGCTPDVYIWTPPGRRSGVIEVKNIEPYVFERTWRDEDGGITPPMAALCQVVLTRHLCDAELAYIAALRVGHGVELDLIEVPPQPALIERLEAAAEAFWDNVEHRTPPPPDYFADAELVIAMRARVEERKTIDLSGNNRIAHLADEWTRLAAQEKEAVAGRKAIKAEIFDIMGDAEIALVNGEVAATAKRVDKRAEEKPRAGYSYRDLRFK